MIGKIGSVAKIHWNGIVEVHYDNPNINTNIEFLHHEIRRLAKLIEQDWNFNPLCLKKVRGHVKHFLVHNLHFIFVLTRESVKFIL